jgi:hypothetical protein
LDPALAAGIFSGVNGVQSVTYNIEAREAGTKTCATCGAAIPARIYGLSVLQTRVFNYVATHPNCEMRGIIGFVYGDSPDGGPLSAGSSVHVQIHKINKKLKPLGQRIKASSSGRGATYRLLALPDSETRAWGDPTFSGPAIGRDAIADMWRSRCGIKQQQPAGFPQSTVRSHRLSMAEIGHSRASKKP